jgi:hypothetical protein
MFSLGNISLDTPDMQQAVVIVEPSSDWVLIVGTIVVPLVLAVASWYWKFRDPK